MLDIKIELTKNRKAKPDMKNNPPEFGTCTTDHMFEMDYDPEHGWHDARIVPYGPFMVEPITMSFHYAQEIFEGMKAFMGPDGNPLMFRPDMNAKRFQRSAKRVCIPTIPVEDYLQAVETFVKVEKEWIPTEPATSLYIRPVAFATQASVGVETATEYKFFIVACPVKNYHTEFSSDDSCWVETKYSRASEGGTGGDKCGCNYANTLLPQEEAVARGYDEIVFADANEHKYIGEISASNIMFVIDGVVVTPELDGTILPGITRDSLLTLCREWGIPCEERKITVDELKETLQNGKCTEAMSTGTAVVIEPIGSFGFEDVGRLIVGDGNVGPISRKLYEGLLAIQRNELEGPEGWLVEIK
ncbi:MAG: branched-chain amino acid aminotransferase [Mobilibacterium timonense]|uniref:branched-chain amino acid aminotransferase n=1 Tax=Mobilibacterium timonense TaxID=1871012 RepID=UPI002354254E|nr:branched-chain amino acid aminotransferase [Mobilibacterium timonense]MBM6990221.1 branched-chain amino acid aminotransferase [Mobilibacterium timonense]